MAEALSPLKLAQPKALLPPDPLFVLKGDMGHIHSISFLTRECVSTSSVLLASTEDGNLHFWNLDTNRRTHKQNLGSSILAIHPLEDELVTQEKSGIIKLWNLRKSNYHLMKTIETTGGFCKSVRVKSDLLINDEKSTIGVIDITNMEKTRTLEPDQENLGVLNCITDINIGNRDYVLGSYETGDTLLWDLDTGKVVSKIKLIENTISISYDPMSSRAVAGNASSVLQIFLIDRNTLEMGVKYEAAIPNDGVNVVKFREDSKVFVSGCWDNRIRYFSCKTYRVLATLTEHKRPISDIQFSPFPVPQWNSTIMAAGGQDGIISLWNLYL